MKALALIVLVLSFSHSTYAKCVVEIISHDGDPLGYVYQESECKIAMNKCKGQLGRLNIEGAKCEITLDIPNSKDKAVSLILLQ